MVYLGPFRARVLIRTMRLMETAHTGSFSGWQRLTTRLRTTARSLGMLIFCVVEIFLFCVSITALSLTAVGIGMAMFTWCVLVIRAVIARQQASFIHLRNITSHDRYQPLPDRGYFARFKTLLGDNATWRDISWMIIDGTAGLILNVIIVSTLTAGIIGPILPAIWPLLPSDTTVSLSTWEVTSRQEALVVGVPYGLFYVVVWWFLTPHIVRWHTVLAHRVLDPSAQDTLTQRVKQLVSSRAETLDHQAAELHRIERDLHDGPQAHLVALGLNLGLAEKIADSDPDAAHRLLGEARQHSAQAISDLRTLVRGIRPPILSDRGLPGAIDALVIKLPLDIEVQLSVPGRLPAAVESAVYFAAAEALANTTKHSQASGAWVHGHHADNMLYITISDNGIGGATLRENGGLRGLERRLAAFDGVLDIASPAGHGTVVSIQVPCAIVDTVS